MAISDTLKAWQTLVTKQRSIRAASSSGQRASVRDKHPMIARADQADKKLRHLVTVADLVPALAIHLDVLAGYDWLI